MSRQRSVVTICDCKRACRRRDVIDMQASKTPCMGFLQLSKDVPRWTCRTSTSAHNSQVASASALLSLDAKAFSIAYWPGIREHSITTVWSSTLNANALHSQLNVNCRADQPCNRIGMLLITQYIFCEYCCIHIVITRNRLVQTDHIRASLLPSVRAGRTCS